MTKYLLGVVCGPWVAVAQDNVMEPVWNDAVCVHEVADCLQHSLEVVLFWLASHNYVE